MRSITQLLHGFAFAALIAFVTGAVNSQLHQRSPGTPAQWQMHARHVGDKVAKITKRNMQRNIARLRASAQNILHGSKSSPTGLSKLEKDVGVVPVATALKARHRAQALHLLLNDPTSQMRTIIKFFENTVARLEELNRYDGREDKMGWCKEVHAGVQKASAPFAEFEEDGSTDDLAPQAYRYVHNNLWALGMIEQELAHLCGQGFGGRAVKGSGRLDNMKMVLGTYEEGMQCRAGDAPCFGGSLVGLPPNCRCSCPGGVEATATGCPSTH